MQRKFKKGGDVTYVTNGSTFRARVETCHRDGSVTVVTQFRLNDDGSDAPGFYGYRYRVDGENLSRLSD